MSEVLTNDSDAMQLLMKMLGLPEHGVTAFELRVHHDKIPEITVTSEIWTSKFVREFVTQDFELVAIEHKQE